MFHHIGGSDSMDVMVHAMDSADRESWLEVLKFINLFNLENGKEQRTAFVSALRAARDDALRTSAIKTFHNWAVAFDASTEHIATGMPLLEQIKDFDELSEHIFIGMCRCPARCTQSLGQQSQRFVTQ